MKFKIGDKVRIIDNKHGHGFNIGEIVEITNKYKGNIEEKIRPHYEAKSVLRNDLWYIEDDEIEKENKSMFTKSNLEVGDMVETRNKEKYIVQNKKILSNSKGYLLLDDYYDNMVINVNNNFDIVKVYRVISNIYECIWDREKDENEILNKKYYIEQIDTSEDCEGEDWSIEVYPNNSKGYGEADGNMQIVLEDVRNEEEVFLSIEGAKEIIKALNEIIDYLEG